MKQEGLDVSYLFRVDLNHGVVFFQIPSTSLYVDRPRLCFVQGLRLAVIYMYI